MPFRGRSIRNSWPCFITTTPLLPPRSQGWRKILLFILGSSILFESFKIACITFEIEREIRKKKGFGEKVRPVVEICRWREGWNKRKKGRQTWEMRHRAETKRPWVNMEGCNLALGRCWVHGIAFCQQLHIRSPWEYYSSFKEQFEYHLFLCDLLGPLPHTVVPPSIALPASPLCARPANSVYQPTLWVIWYTSMPLPTLSLKPEIPCSFSNIPTLLNTVL